MIIYLISKKSTEPLSKYLTLFVSKVKKILQVCHTQCHSFNQVSDYIKLTNLKLQTGPNPNATRGTLVYLPVRPQQTTFPDDTNRWALRFERKTSNNDILLQVHIAPNSQVGIWACSVQTQIKGQRMVKREHKVMKQTKQSFRHSRNYLFVLFIVRRRNLHPFQPLVSRRYSVLGK